MYVHVYIIKYDSILDCTNYKQFLNFRVIEKAISSAYATFCQMYLQNSWSSIGSASDALEQKSVSSFQSSFIDLPRELTQMLASAGPYLHRDAVLLQKVCWKLYLILFYMCACKSCIL